MGLLVWLLAAVLAAGCTVDVNVPGIDAAVLQQWGAAGKTGSAGTRAPSAGSAGTTTPPAGDASTADPDPPPTTDPEKRDAAVTVSCSCSETSECCDGCEAFAGEPCGTSAPCLVQRRCQFDGTCSPVAISPDNTRCDDQDGCTVGDHCVSGVCESEPRICELPNAASTCSAGGCQVDACSDGFGDCDGEAENGCEAPIDTPENCGACGRSCPVAHGAGGCDQGDCVIADCDPGWGDCDGYNHDFSTGCETSLRTEENCGVCGAPCVAFYTVDEVSCATGVCLITECSPGFYDCDGKWSGGCERDSPCG